MTNHKKLIDITASLERNCVYLEKKWYTKNRSVCKNAVTNRLSIGVACFYLLAPATLYGDGSLMTACQIYTFAGPIKGQ